MKPTDMRRSYISDCWEWCGTIGSHGYGVIGKGGKDSKILTTHRLAFEICNGGIPLGLYVLHRCDNRRCVNPHHLFLGTHLDNVRDMLAKGRGAKPPSRWRKDKQPCVT